MRTAGLLVEWSKLSWLGLRQKLAPGGGPNDCIHARRLWRRLRGRPGGVLFEGSTYCVDRCLERVVRDTLGRLKSAPRRAPAAHRVPLGLLLLSRQQLSAEQLRQALAAQRSAGRGKIGEWLQTLGFVSDEQVTAALAWQWSCPVLRVPLPPSNGRVPRVPAILLELFAMFAVDYVPSTSTLHVAFSERIDYTILYAIEQMLGCRTEPCLVVPGWLNQKLQALSECHLEDEIVLERADTAEFARSIRSYSMLTAASEVRLASCGPHLWARLLRPERPPLDLVLRSQAERHSPSQFGS
jgi:hypothetical protein